MSDPASDGRRGERIAKWLARAGVASRRDAEKLIAEGQVQAQQRGWSRIPPPSSRPATSWW